MGPPVTLPSSLVGIREAIKGNFDSKEMQRTATAGFYAGFVGQGIEYTQIISNADYQLSMIITSAKGVNSINNPLSYLLFIKDFSLTQTLDAAKAGLQDAWNGTYDSAIGRKIGAGTFNYLLMTIGGAQLKGKGNACEAVESGTPSTTDRIRNVAQQSFDYAVNNPRKQGLNRMQLGKDAEIQATRWTRKWAERNGIDLSESGLHFQVRGEHSIPDVVYEPTKNIMDFKLTPKAVRKKQSDNFKSDFPGYSIEYIFGPGPWREQDEH